ncbi:MAG: translation initiation factor IF-3 [Dehalococcoidales bacterium]|nr:translation initiation factor IF-3 [Dehalococcoidales bacterium]MDP6576884.1 translation initiation factor IF-3 [Dehalococcoidales bacterium]
MEEVNGDIIKRLRVNHMIRVREVRLVGEKGEQLGIMPLFQAQETARKYSLDLVEVAPNAEPPVCRLLDYGRFKYQQAKKEQEMKKGQKASLLREVRLRPKIGDHDFGAKARNTRKLLGNGAKVKVTIMFRGREITHPELGYKLLQRMVESLGTAAILERQAVLEGKRMNIILVPATTKSNPSEDIKEETKKKAKEEVKEARDAEN